MIEAFGFAAGSRTAIAGADRLINIKENIYQII